MTPGSNTGQMAWQILTLAIGCHHVGARVQAKSKWGASRRPIVSCATRSGFKLGCWSRGFYVLFTYSLWGCYLEGRLRQVVAAAAARSVPERPSRVRRRHIRYFTVLPQFTRRSAPLTPLSGRSAPLTKKWLSPLIRLES